MADIVIKINNWEKYHGRKDIKRPWWFALSNTIFSDMEFSSLTSEEKLAWIGMLCYASRKNSASFLVCSDIFAHDIRLTESAIFGMLKKAIRFKWIQKIRTASVRDPYGTGHNITEHNITEQENYCSTDVERVTDSDLLKIYEKFPRKQGKTTGLRKLRSQIRSRERLSLVDRAVGNYVAHLTRSGTSGKFVKIFSSWVSEWEDWIDKETGIVKDMTSEKLQAMKETNGIKKDTSND